MKTNIKEFFIQRRIWLGFLVTIFGILAGLPDICLLFGTNISTISFWFASNVLNVISLLLLLIFIFLLIVIYNQNKQIKILKQINEDITMQEGKHKDVLKHFIRFLRSVSLLSVQNPSKDTQLNLFMTKLRDNLPNNGSNFRVVLAIPERSGKFSIEHSIGIEQIKVNQLKNNANWKMRKSFFAHGMFFEDKNYKILYNEDDLSYMPEKPKEDYESTKAHLIVAFKDDIYKYEKSICNGCLAILTISTTDKNLMKKEKEDHYYRNIYSAVKGIEGVLLQYNLIEAK